MSDTTNADSAPVQTRNAAGNMTLPVEVADISTCLDLIEAVSIFASPNSGLDGVRERLAVLLRRPAPEGGSDE